VYTARLTKTIKKYNNETIPNSVKEQIYSKLVYLNVDSKENRQAHVKTIHKDIADRDNKVKNDVCPKCGGKLDSIRIYKNFYMQ
jgi:uncharacterized protein with PIN domain